MTGHNDGICCNMLILYAAAYVTTIVFTTVFESGSSVYRGLSFIRFIGFNWSIKDLVGYRLSLKMLAGGVLKVSSMISIAFDKTRKAASSFLASASLNKSQIRTNCIVAASFLEAQRRLGASGRLDFLPSAIPVHLILSPASWFCNSLSIWQLHFQHSLGCVSMPTAQVSDWPAARRCILWGQITRMRYH